MDICRKYCSEIIKERNKLGFNSIKYPLITVEVNRYFMPEYRKIIADECNIIGYLDIEPVERLCDVEQFELNNKIIIKLDTTKSDWQQLIFETRNKKRLEAQERKDKDIKNNA